MANNKKKKNNKNTKSNNAYKNKNQKDNSKILKKSIVMKILVVLGVIVFCTSIFYLMNYFFVEHNDIKINMSTDKKVEFINIDGEDTLITTQKYVSDLEYSMRYDVNNFRVFKYRDQDFYKYKDAEKVILIVDKSTLPKSCAEEEGDNGYSKCTLEIDDYTEENYISFNGQTYKLTVKNPNTDEYRKKIKARVDYMIKSFEMNI